MYPCQRYLHVTILDIGTPIPTRDIRSLIRVPNMEVLEANSLTVDDVCLTFEAGETNVTSLSRQHDEHILIYLYDQTNST
jgi:hypothetical protein